MNRVAILGAVGFAVAAALALVFGDRGSEAGANVAPAGSAPTREAAAASGADGTSTSDAARFPDAGLLYGRVTLSDGTAYEGRLRWGGDEEALWSHYFNGRKEENPWAAYVARDLLPTDRHAIEVLGFEIVGWDTRRDLGRPVMVRFGDIARIEPRGRDLRVTLKSGTAYDLDRFEADDVADGLRIWDAERGVVDLGEWPIRSIELMPSPGPGPGASPAVPDASLLPLYGTVRTTDGDFTGLIQWNREAALRGDVLEGVTDDGDASVRFGDVRSIARGPSGTALVKLGDGRQLVVSADTWSPVGHRGVYVDDVRYGRVLVSWEAFERVDFTPGGAVSSYGDFAPGRLLAGRVVTRSGQALSGRLVFDLDESESIETLDAPSGGVDYTLPFGLVAAIRRPGPEAGEDAPVDVKLHSGEVLRLEPSGDLGEGNLGVLIFPSRSGEPAYVPWSEVERIYFEASPAPVSAEGVAG